MTGGPDGPSGPASSDRGTRAAPHAAEADLPPQDDAGASGPALRCVNVVHVYGAAGAGVVALRGIDLSVAAGEMVAVVGSSGAGKSTLLWLLAGLIRPTAGRLFVHGRALGDLSSGDLASLRARQVGVLLQNPARNLLPYGTALDNVLFAQRPTRRRPAVKSARSRALLDAVGLDAQRDRVAGALSGGEQQRLGLAMALANGPAVLLADEPTSQLDAASAARVVDLLQAARKDLGTTVLMVTHDEALAAQLDRAVTIRDGRIGAEARAGQDYVVIGRDGALHLPPEVLDVLPPGTLAEVRRTSDGIELRPAGQDGDKA
ncbi:MAG: ABC transporter ATP-binding protein [Intrasporangium sp.]|uniref:ABC transporter ATP-binding protein n=1 Tax=Intrasporangium sp. TaxID=1925024 RepID=UPI0026492444|nr:ABC transporter ATP-binding protein [Intrasporangium sp.]MDN5794180.1 ABC transporter ATP-binding protein [Intrasporangium sp.]